MGLSTGIGSMPGTDYAESVRIALGAVGLAFVPELPARGTPAGMVGRTLGLLDGMGADLQPEGWRVGTGEGIDQRRARSLLAQDLDVVEELAAEHEGPVKTQVVGPLTLAAAVERPRGDKMLADHGARRDLAESLASGVGEHVRDLKRRVGGDVVVQVDEPMVDLVLSGRVPTASGWTTHRAMHPPEADDLLRRVVVAVVEAGGTPVVHSCAADVPVRLLAGAGFTAVSFDLSLSTASDDWAETFDDGVDLWLGVVPSTEAPVLGNDLWARVVRFYDRLGFEEGSFEDRLVVTPTCGLAGASPAWARRALAIASDVGGGH